MSTDTTTVSRKPIAPGPSDQGAAQPAAAVSRRGKVRTWVWISLAIGALILGLVAATLATNQAQVSLMTILVVAPMINLSGTWTPPEAMPGWLSALMLLSPLHHFVSISYGIQLKGVGLDILWPSVSAMVALGGSLFGFGIWRFRRQFE